MKRSFIAAVLVLIFGSPAVSQKIKIASGDLDFLKGQKTIHVEYNYEDMGVGKYEQSEDYVEDRVEKMNKKEAGTGDEWKEKWVADREERFEPQFEELANKYLESNFEIGDFPDAEYTLIVYTVFTEPGFNVGVARKNAYVDLDLVFVKTASPEEEVAVVTITKSPGRGGMGYDFDTGYRIQEAYAKAGKELAQYIVKRVL